ncbi:MAG: helix-hairpin-helix domain-containing protein [Halobacteriaceae archaeon]
MNILHWLKSKFGIEDQREPPENVTVSIEQERAVKQSNTTAVEDVDVIKGIGESYRETLQAKANIETVQELAEANPSQLAEQTELSEKRLRRWIERAKERRD